MGWVKEYLKMMWDSGAEKGKGMKKHHKKKIEKLGGKIVGASFIIELTFLNPRKKMKKYDIFSLVEYN